MAKITIGALTDASLPLGGTERIALVQGGLTKDAAISDLPASDAVVTALAGKVGTTGNETVAGVKTFSSSPIVPNPVGATEAASKGYVDGMAAGAPPGAMLPYAAATPPAGYLLCDGSAVSRTTYAALFAVISTTWGVGDGSTTFNLPDMRAAAPVGSGTSTGYTQNETLTLGTKYNDQFQGFQVLSGLATDSATPVHGIYGATTTGAPGSATDPTASASGNQTHQFKGSYTSDGTNGTPRTGNVTRGKVVAVNYIIKY